MIKGKGRKAVNKIDQNQADLPPSREEKHGHQALRHDVELPYEDTALSTVAYTIGIGLVLYLAYIVVTYGISSLT